MTNETLKQEFEDLVISIKSGNIDFQVSNIQKLELYGLYKQATLGDCPDDEVKSNDFIKKAKFMAWKKHRGLTEDEAMKTYIKLSKNI